MTAGTTIRVVIPTEIEFRGTNGQNISTCKVGSFLNPASIVDFPCSFTQDNGNGKSEISGTVATDITTNIFTFKMGTFVNPSSTITVSPFEVYLTGGSLSLMSNSVPGFNYQPEALLEPSLATGGLRAGEVTTYTFKFKISSSIPQGGLIDVIFPTGTYESMLTKPTAPTGKAIIYGVETTFNLIADQSNQLLTFSGLFNNGPLSPNSSQFIELQLFDIKNPVTMAESNSFSVRVKTASLNAVSQITSGLTVTPDQPSNLTFQIISNNYKVNALPMLQFNVVLQNSYPEGGKIQITFPDEMTITPSAMLLLAFGVNSPVMTVNGQVMDIKGNISNASQASISLLISVMGIQNPLGVMTTGNFSIKTFDATDQPVSTSLGVVTLTITQGELSVSSPVRSERQIQKTSNYSLKVTTENAVSPVSKVKFVLPKDQIDLEQDFVCKDTATSTVLDCSGIDKTGADDYVLTIPQWCTSTTTNCAAGTFLDLTIESATNPAWIVEPLTSTVQVQTINVYNGNDVLIDEILTGIQFGDTLQPGTLGAVTSERTAGMNIVGESTQYDFDFNLVSNVPAGGYVLITFPELSLYKNPSTAIACENFLTSSSLDCDADFFTSPNIKHVKIVQACSSGCAGGQNMKMRIKSVFNPGNTKPLTNSYLVQTFTSSNFLIDDGSTTNTLNLALVRNSFAASQIKLPVTPKVVGKVQTYELSVTPKNPIPVSPSYLLITFPTDFGFSAGACTSQSGGNGLDCEVVHGSRQIKVNSSGTEIPSNVEILIGIDNVIRNPQSAEESQRIKVESFYQTGGADYDIDFEEALTFTPDTPNDILDAQLIRSESLKDEVTQVTMSFKMTNPVPIGSKVVVEIPEKQFVPETTKEAVQFTSGGTLTVVATGPDAGYYKFVIDQWCGGGSSACSAGQSLTATITGIKNPPNTIPATQSVKITTQNATGASIDAVTSDIFASPAVSAGPLQSATISRTGTTMVGGTPVFEFALKTTNPLSDSYVSVTFPHGLVYRGDGNPTCQIDGVDAACQIADPIESNAYGQIVQNLRATMACPTETDCPAGKEFTLTVTGIKNAFTTRPVTGLFRFSTQKFDSASSQFYNVDVLDIQSALSDLTVGSAAMVVQRETSNVDAQTAVVIEVTLNTRIGAGEKVQIDIPLEQFLRDGTPIEFQKFNGAAYETAQPMEVEATTGSYVTVEFVEFCSNGGTSCPDATSMKIKINKGFKNPYHIQTSFNTFFSVKSQTSDELYDIDQSTAQIQASDLTKADINTIEVTFQKAAVSHIGDIDFSFILGGQVKSTDYLIFETTDEFFYKTLSGSQTCAKLDDLGNETAGSCTFTFDETTGQFRSVKIENVCGPDFCPGETATKIRLKNVHNLLEAKAFVGSFVIKSQTSDTVFIGEGTLDISTLTTLVPNELLDQSVTRALIQQGVQANYLVKFIIPGMLLDQSKIKISLPKNQVVRLGALACTDSPDNNNLGCTEEPAADSNYNYVTMTEFKCPDGQNCAENTVFEISMSNTENPLVSPLDLNSFKVDITSPDGNQIFVSSEPLNALPELEVGPLISLVITHQNTEFIKETTEYYYEFETSSNIPSGGKIIIYFPNERIFQDTSTTLQCKMGDAQNSQTCTPSWLNNADGLKYMTSLEITGLCGSGCPAQVFKVLLQGGIQNPPYVAELSGPWAVQTTDSSNAVVNKGSRLYDEVTPIKGTPLKNYSVTRSSTDLGAKSGYTIFFINKTPIPLSSSFFIDIPLDQVEVRVDPISCWTSLNQQIQTCQTVKKTDTMIRIQVQEWCSGGTTPCPEGTELSLVLRELYNPTKLAANVSTSSWMISTTNDEGQIIDQNDQPIIAIPPLDGAAVIVSTAGILESFVQRETEFNVAFTPGTNLGSSNHVQILFPTGLIKKPSTESCSAVTPPKSGSCTYTEDADGFVTEIKFNAGICSSCAATNLMVIKANVLMRDDDKTVGGKFVVITGTSSSDIGIGEITNSIVLKPEQFQEPSVTTNDCTQIFADCAMDISFKAVNAIPNAVNGGRITVAVPTDILITSTTCTATITGIDPADVLCSMEGNLLIAKHSTTNTLKGSTILFKLAEIKNPGSNKPTPSFILKSEKKDSLDGNYYNIDGISDALIYQATGLGSITNVEIERESINNGQKVNRPSSHLFKFDIENNLTGTAAFVITLPKESDTKLLTGATQKTCKQMLTKEIEGKVLICETNVEARTIKVMNYCDGGTPCSSGSTIQFKLFNDFIQNMGWIKEPLEVTDSFEIKSTTPDGNWFIDGITEGVVAAPTLLPDLLTLPSPEIARSNNDVSKRVTWEARIKLNSNAIPQKGRIYFAIPENVIYDMGESVDTKIDGSLLASTTKELYTPTSTSVKTLTALEACNGKGELGCIKGLVFTVIIDWVKNPPFVIQVNDKITIYTTTEQGWKIDEGYTQPVNSLFSQLVMAEITSTNIVPKDPTAGATTPYDIIFTADTDIPKDSYVEIKVPSSLKVEDPNGADLCNNLFDPATAITCTVTGNETDGFTIKVEGLFPDENNSGQFGLTFENLINSDTTGNSETFSFAIKSPDNLPIAEKTNSAFAEIKTPVSNCSVVCKTCAGTENDCTSCNTPGDLPILKENQCVNSCGEGYFFMESLQRCFQCHESCKSCYGYDSHQCVDCNTGFNFQNGSCVEDCGKYTSPTELGCQNSKSCSNSECESCTKDLNWCLKCKEDSTTPVADIVTGQCVATKDGSCNKPGFYADSETKRCELCDFGCKDCEEKADFCVACYSFFDKPLVDWLNFKCVSECPAATFFSPDTNDCPMCNPVCADCTGATPLECTGCQVTPNGQQLYLFESQCALACPKPYTENLETNICENQPINLVSFPTLFVIGALIVSIILAVLSKLISKKKSKFFEEIYAYMSAVEFFDRLFLLGNLWVSTKIFSFAICFMNIMATAVLGIFFYNLFLQPILEHSPHFRTLYKGSRKTFIFLIAGSFIVGVNFIRFLYAIVFGTYSTNTDLDHHFFFVKPLNNMANFTLILTAIQFILDVIILFDFTVARDAWALAIFGALFNVVLILFQIAKIIQTKRFVQRYQQLSATRH